MNVVIDKAYSRGYAHHGWLKTYHTFSFANYYNPKRMHFGMLRVLNDDTVAPGRGFDMHQHKNMEVVSIPLQGYLRHGDNIENADIITPGYIQVMSAGTGIFHSEYNNSKTDPLEFLQIWVFPEHENTDPHYKNYDIRSLLKPDELKLIISPDGSTPASIQQNAWFSLGTLQAGMITPYSFYSKTNGVYLFVIEGSVRIGDITLSYRDGAGFWDTEKILIEVRELSQLLLIEVPMT